MKLYLAQNFAELQLLRLVDTSGHHLVQLPAQNRFS